MNTNPVLSWMKRISPSVNPGWPATPLPLRNG